MHFSGTRNSVIYADLQTDSGIASFLYDKKRGFMQTTEPQTQ